MSAGKLLMCSQIVDCSRSSYYQLNHSITIFNTVTAAAPPSVAASVPNGEVSCIKLKFSSSPFHVAFIQVLMLKSLLSRAEIDKRKLQLQLDIKVN